MDKSLIQELVSAGPDGVHEVVRRILRDGAAASAQEEAGALQVPGSFPAHAHARPADNGLHNLAPVGARSCQSSSIRCTGISAVLSLTHITCMHH